MTNQQAPEAPRGTAADGKTELFNVPGYPLMVRAADFNRLHAENERLAALVDAQQPDPSAAAMGDVDLPDAEDMAHSAVQEALSFGLSHDVIHRWMRHIQDQTVKAMLAAPQPSPTPQADSAPASVAGTMQFCGCPECGSRTCVARQCSRTMSHTAQALPGVQWQCGPQASGFTAPQADSQPAPEYVGNGMFKGETIQKAAEHWANWCYVRCMTGLSEFLRVVAARATADSVLEDAARLWEPG